MSNIPELRAAIAKSAAIRQLLNWARLVETWEVSAQARLICAATPDGCGGVTGSHAAVGLAVVCGALFEVKAARALQLLHVRRSPNIALEAALPNT